MKSTPEPATVGWINAIPGATVFLSAVTQAEILYGVALVPEGNDSRSTASISVDYRMSLATADLPNDPTELRVFWVGQAAGGDRPAARDQTGRAAALCTVEED
jgi:hypothetical protein